MEHRHDFFQHSKQPVGVPPSALLQHAPMRGDLPSHSPSAVVAGQALSLASAAPDGGGGRLAISFLLNPSASGTAAPPQATSAGHKRKEVEQVQQNEAPGGRDSHGHHSRTSSSLSPAGGGARGGAEVQGLGDDDERHRRRRLAHVDEPHRIDGDASVYRLPQDHPYQHQAHHYHRPHHLHQDHGEQDVRGMSPQRSSRVSSSSSSSSSSLSAAPRQCALPSFSSIMSSSSASPAPPSPTISSQPTRTLPSLPPLSPASASMLGSVGSLGLSFTSADPSFFFHSFNCLPSAMSARMDSDTPDTPPPLPQQQGSSTTTTGTASETSASSGGFFYTPYERSQSAPASPKLFVGDDTGLPDGDEVEEEEYVAPARQPTLTPEQLQLRIQTNALQTQLLLRQMQRTQETQRLKQLHAQQCRQRTQSQSASASFASSPARAGEGGRRRRFGGDDDDDLDDGNNDNAANGVDQERGEVDSAEQQLNARRLEDRLKLLKKRIIGSNGSEDGGGATGQSISAHQLQEKRKRATPQQLQLLEETFSFSPFPGVEEKQLLAQRLGMSVRSVTIWFQNKRARLKKYGEKNNNSSAV